MEIMEDFLKRLEEEGIPSYSMSESELKRAIEIMKELVESGN